MRLAHPFIPFLTEEIWQRVAPLAGAGGDTVMLAAFPRADEAHIDAAAESDVTWLQQAIIAVRNIRGELGIPPGRKLVLMLRNAGHEERRRVAEHGLLLSTMAKLESVTVLDTAEAPASATQVIGQTELLVPLAGLIDVDAECARLEREEEKLAREIEKLEARLGNAGFVDKAPAEVVARERARVLELTGARNALARQREGMRNAL
jgi:valyl-tRNA synthetase